MPDLTDDEVTVLTLAAQGNSMMAVARWEKPADSLVEKGFLVRHDKFNHSITPAGRKALEQTQQQDEAALDNAIRQIMRAPPTAVSHGAQISQKQAAVNAEMAANHLVLAVQLSCSVTGDSIELAARQWAEQILAAALEKLR